MFAAIMRFAAIPAVRIGTDLVVTAATVGSSLYIVRALKGPSSKPDFMRDHAHKAASLTIKEKWAMLKS